MAREQRQKPRRGNQWKRIPVFQAFIGGI